MTHGYKAYDFAGRRFGRLLVVERAFDRPAARASRWLCICDCGASKIVEGRRLQTGASRSCGCYRREATGNARRTHGHSGTRTYTCWAGMLDRCRRPTSTSWPFYGGRGIAVCERWNTYQEFLDDMGVCPEGMSIDRIDNDGNYEPGNCVWATAAEQNSNTRRNVIVEVGGELITMTEASRRYGVNVSTIKGRLERGWPAEQAVMDRPGARGHSKW